ncbi:MAG: class I SAM-dependent methyltransferase [Deltaproteobacteria bacterium]|nr:class I SAM-dependent methyltransferase [Deltaproteobacteria bacterium]
MHRVINYILSFPYIYKLFINCLKNKKTDLYGDYINVPEKSKVMDIGCGPAQVLDRIPDSVEYHGFDLSETYIRAATKKYNHRNAFFKCAPVESETLEPSLVGSFDMVLALGVLHHINDEAASRLLQLAKTAMKDKGVLITHDPCFLRQQQKLMAKTLARMDRGKYVRYPDQYESLVASFFSDQVETFVRNDALRLPYNIIVMRMVK